MKSIKCQECGFVGWSDAETCKGCGAPVVERASTPFQPSPLPISPVEPLEYESWDESGQGVKKGLAIFALVLGIVSFLTFGLLGIGAVTGIIVAVVAMGKVKRAPLQYGGRGMAIAGLVLSITSLTAAVPVGLVAAIAIPNLLASYRAANEGSALHSLRKISAAEATYFAQFQRYGTLDELASQQLIDRQLGTGLKNGYVFTVHLTTNFDTNEPRFEVVSVPVKYNSSGRRSFYTDETSAVHAGDNHGGPASKMDEQLNADYENPFPRRKYTRDVGY